MGNKSNNVKYLSIFALVVFCVLIPLKFVSANESDRKLVAGFIVAPPLGYYDEGGKRAGFFVALAKAIADEIDVDLEFYEASSIRDFVQKYAAGEIDLMAGVARLPISSETGFYSDPVAIEALRLMTTVEKHKLLKGKPFEGLTIGTVQHSAGSKIKTIADQNKMIEYTSAEEILIHLLTGIIDAALIPTPTAIALSRKAGIDNRVTFLEENVAQISRHVVVNKQHEDLIPKINSAIKRLNENGTLQRLRHIYFIDIPQPVPEILTVGIMPSGPFSIENEDGSFSGFGVEMLEDLADLTGLKFQYEKISGEERLNGFSKGIIDMIPLMSVSDMRRQTMDLAYNVLNVPISIYMRANDQVQLDDISDLSKFKVISNPGGLPNHIASMIPSDNMVRTNRFTRVIDGLVNGEADIALAPKHMASGYIKRRGLEDKVLQVDIGEIKHQLAPALRFGLGSVQDQLNAVIPSYLLSDEYRELQDKYFGQPVFWNTTRISVFVIAIASLFIGLFAYLFRQKQKQRLSDVALDKEQAHSEELSLLVSELERSNGELAQFAYICSHDLQQPMRHIKSFSKLLEETIQSLTKTGKEQDDINLYLGYIQKAATNGQELIKGILDYSKVDHNAHKYEAVDCNEIFRQIFEVVQSEDYIKQFDIPEKLPVVSGQRTQIYQLFLNLVSNAIKYVQPGVTPKIKVHAFDEDEYWRIEVSDNGIGIEPKNHDNIFHIFSRLNQKSEYSGVGIGLSICKKIVDHHRGKISVSSELGKGATFKVSLRKWQELTEIQ